MLAFIVVLFLLLAIALVFGQSCGLAFVNYDDPDYVTANEHVRGGLTWEAIRWAFTATHSNNWHPLTSIWHIVDYGIFGPWAGGHHLVNVLLHAATSVSLFLVLRRATGDVWPSALVSALFAVHPLHVESVAWVSERKDVLSGLCCMLTFWAYLGYSQRSFSFWRYAAVMVFFTLGLLAKQTLVTLPFILFLLDYWPLYRFGKPTGHEKDIVTKPFPWRFVWEKLPLLMIAAAA